MQVIAIFFLWQTTGPASMAGIAVLVILAPINGGILVSVYTKYQVGTKRTLNNIFTDRKGRLCFQKSQSVILSTGVSAQPSLP